jgi:cytochrome P450
LFGYLDDLVGRMLEAPGKGVLSGLAERVTAGELTRAEAAQTGVLLLVAGHETTANMIALGTLALFEHPEQFRLLRTSEDPRLINSAVEELLRYLSITHLGRRRVAAEDIEFAGQLIRAGEGIIFPNEIANRDPEAFAEPHRLDLSRDARTHLAFGFGAHQCLGQPLARLELDVALTTLYRRIPTLRPASELDEINFKHDHEVYGVSELPVTW